MSSVDFLSKYISFYNNFYIVWTTTTKYIHRKHWYKKRKEEKTATTTTTIRDEWTFNYIRYGNFCVLKKKKNKYQIWWKYFSLGFNMHKRIKKSRNSLNNEEEIFLFTSNVVHMQKRACWVNFATFICYSIYFYLKVVIYSLLRRICMNFIFNAGTVHC